MRYPKNRARRLAGAVAVIAVAALPVGVFAAPAGAQEGDATGIEATISVLGIPVVIPPTPFVALPPGGQQQIVNFNGPLGLASASVLSVSSQQAGSNGVVGSAAVTNAAAIGLVTAGLVTSACAADPGGADATSALLATTIAGVPVAVSVPPNTGVAGIATINEQVRGGGGVTVRAVHVTVPGIGDIVISESACFGGSDVAGASVTAADATAGTPNLAG